MDPKVFGTKVNGFLPSIDELIIVDKEVNQTIEMFINRYFGSETCLLVNDRVFVTHLLMAFIRECLIPEDSVKQFAINESQLSLRSKVMKKFVHNYIEYQLNVILVLIDIKLRLDITDGVFNDIIKILERNGVVSEEASNHWFKSNVEFGRRVETIINCLKFLDWVKESREEHFYETNFGDSEKV